MLNDVPIESASAPDPPTDAAWLIFKLWKKERAGREAWLKRQPIGVKVLHEILTNSGANVGTCSPNAPHPSVVLVSLTSEHDALAFFNAVSEIPEWQPGRRTFRVVAGGYGMQNPYPLEDYVDYAYFGRAEDHVAELVAAAGARKPFEVESVMFLREGVAPVKVRQARTLYEGMAYQEDFTGCPLKCAFCHYTFARKHKGSDHAYSRKSGTAGAYVLAIKEVPAHLEVTWPQLLDWPHEKYYADITVGLDGPSERLRFLYGKRISDDEVALGLTRYFAGCKEAGLKGTKLKVFDIAGFPGETLADREKMARAMARAEVPEDFHALVMVHPTPFKPSPWTPMQWEAFALEDFTGYKRKTLCGWGPETFVAKNGETYPVNQAYYSRFIEGPGAQIDIGAIIRHDGSEEHKRVFRVVANSGKFRRLKSKGKLRALRSSFPEVAENWLGQHEVGAPLPTAVAEATQGPAFLERVASKLRERLAEDKPLKGKTLAGNPVGVALPVLQEPPVGSLPCASPVPA